MTEYPMIEYIVLPSCRAALLIAGLFLLYYFLGTRISPAMRHAFWGLVLIALLPLAIPSPVSVYHLLPAADGGTDGRQQTADGSRLHYWVFLVSAVVCRLLSAVFLQGGSIFG